MIDPERHADPGLSGKKTGQSAGWSASFKRHSEVNEVNRRNLLIILEIATARSRCFGTGLAITLLRSPPLGEGLGGGQFLAFPPNFDQLPANHLLRP